MITGKNYIGKELSAKGEITYQTINPQTNKQNSHIHYEASTEEVNEAVNKATMAFEIYKNITERSRAEFLNEIANNIEALGQELTDIYIQESGLPEGRAKGECSRTVGQLRTFAEMVKEGSWVEAIINSEKGKPDLRRMLEPLGPVVVFGASNFPLAFSTAGGDTASALAAGCPVIIKSHPLHAGTGELVAAAIIKAAEKTEMPDGVFSNINSSGIATGQLLVSHAQIKAVGFTGSIKAGLALCDLAAKRETPIPVYAEMGSINPVVVLPSALKEKSSFWAEQYAGSITAATGQFCTNPGLILGIKSLEWDNFIDNLGDKLAKTAPACMLHPTIKKQYDSSRHDIVLQSGAISVASGEKSNKENYPQQEIIAVEGETFLKNKNFHKEVFGPFSVAVACKDQNELNSLISNLEGQLTGTILNEDENELLQFSKTIDILKSRVGRLIYNGVPTGVEVCEAMTHGGPFPATSDSKFTSVGLTAAKRWVRPVSYQDWPDRILPDALKNKNPLKILRKINNKVTKDSL